MLSKVSMKQLLKQKLLSGAIFLLPDSRGMCVNMLGQKSWGWDRQF